MVTVVEVLTEFVEPVSRRFNPPKGGQPFLDDLAMSLTRFTKYQLQRGLAYLTDKRTSGYFPTIAECVKACEGFPPEPAKAAALSGKFAPVVDDSFNAKRKALELVRGNPAMAALARKENWLNALLDFAEEKGRLPSEREVSMVIVLARRADAAANTPQLLEWRKAMHQRAADRVFGRADK